MWPNRDVSCAPARELNANFISGRVCVNREWPRGYSQRERERERAMHIYGWAGSVCTAPGGSHVHAGVLSGSMAGASRIGAASAACTWRGRGLVAPSITSQLPALANTTHNAAFLPFSYM
jgi:hypothetical protein